MILNQKPYRTVPDLDEIEEVKIYLIQSVSFKTDLADIQSRSVTDVE